MNISFFYSVLIQAQVFFQTLFCFCLNFDFVHLLLLLSGFFQYSFSTRETVQRVQWIWDLLLLETGSDTISIPDRLPDILGKVMLLRAVPLNKFFTKAHFILENIPLRIFMGHAFIVFSQDEIMHILIRPRVFLQMLQNDYCFG